MTALTKKYFERLNNLIKMVEMAREQSRNNCMVCGKAMHNDHAICNQCNEELEKEAQDLPF